MFVLRSMEAGQVRHSSTVQQPLLIQGDAYILLLLVLACGIIWFSSFRHRPQCHTAVRETRDNSDECLFTIRQLNKTTYLIRENDRFGEYPHIYVKKHTESLPDGRTASILIVNDTGCGTTAPDNTTKPQERNIKNFIDHHLNPTGETPYLVILSHCHYDHILGLVPILCPAKEAREGHSSRTLIMSSSHNRDFLQPRTNLREHSLCSSMGLHCPTYKTSIWAQHNQHIAVTHPKLGVPTHIPITTLHTPGHTPDSLSWFDQDERVLYIGDSFYEQESPDSRTAPWGRENSAPILFPNQGNLVDWWLSINTLIAFVEEKNAVKGEKRVTLSAGHVTVGVDALACLLDVKQFMKRVLRGEVRLEERPEKRGERFGVWREEGGRFSLGAPLRVVEEGRLRIPEEERRR